ncbi:hypothetical protein MTBPR1_30092 [Candidatus Terasakiella magnetica]|uniref:Uncharacterized protein n=1 Tax=Candidatus Terasakiella magnetica TaxID=1867952 RepID=A0A1C3RHP4_9PROT|nr:replication-relaxation family protein [Candidatus Terasakiella magnetica]SCA56722.1 hypothetical protein MTBPR1_30092 [Candidatus Terasakiella magnetica]
MAANPKITGTRPRDISILYHLWDKVSLTTTHIHKLCFQELGRDSVYKTVSALKQRGFVQAATYDFGRKGKLEDLHFLTRKGFQRLQQSGIFELEEAKFLTKNAPQLVVDYAHRVGIIDYWISLELDIQRQDRFELALFVPEYKKLDNGNNITLKCVLANGKPLSVRNDSLFIIRDCQTELEYLFLLEIDRGTMPVTMSESLREALQNNIAIRANLESKVIKIQSIFSYWHEAIKGLGKRFQHFDGARIVIVTSSSQRVLNIARSSPPKPAAFLISYFTELSAGAFYGRYAEGGSLRSTTLQQHLFLE